MTTKKVTKKIKTKIAFQAREWLDDFGINWTIYGNPEVQSGTGEDTLSDFWFVTWTNTHGKKIRLGNIVIDDDGTILQAGENSGELTF